MLKLAFRALAIALYTLGAAAMIVDARREGGLPEGFPFLAQLRETRDRFAGLGGAPASLPIAPIPRDGAGGLSDRPPRLAAAAGGGEAPGFAAGAPEEGTAPVPDLSARPDAVQVNRGLP